MGNSMAPPAALAGARITHDLSGSVITIEQRGPQMVHTLTEHGLTAEYPVAYQIGSGKIGYTYLVRIGDYLFESPASWYRSHGWDTSPGYQRMPDLDFDRLVDSACLFCHADRAEFTGVEGRRYSGRQLTAIGCDRCHGPGDEHARHPSAKNIVNPAKLPPAARNSVCEQCHLEGETRVLNPGKRWLDFHPGERFDVTAVTYLASQDRGPAHAVSQAEQLARSKCVAGSGGRLWCATCHNPHQQTADAAVVRKVCLGCHATVSNAAHPAGMAECVSCHMPRLAADDIPHTASTDHRILRRPEPPDSGNFSPDALVAWSEPPAQFKDRDLALADLLVSVKYRSNVLRDSGSKLLNGIVIARDEKDSTLLSALAGNALERKNQEQGVALARQAVESAPDSGHAALILAIALRQSGDAAGAEREYRHATELDPSSKQAWIELAMLYGSQGRMDDVMAVFDRYLAWNPQSILFRQQKAKLSGKH
jgi:predicted CXXCH cytochrome family protein